MRRDSLDTHDRLSPERSASRVSRSTSRHRSSYRKCARPPPMITVGSSGMRSVHGRGSRASSPESSWKKTRYSPHVCRHSINWKTRPRSGWKGCVTRNVEVHRRSAVQLTAHANPYVERLIGSIRRECLDHMIVLNAAHLRRILTIYSQYYHRSRTHLGLEKDAPDPRPVSRHPLDRSSRFPKSSVFITATNGRLRKRKTLCNCTVRAGIARGSFRQAIRSERS